MWAIGIIATFALMYLALNYANVIRYQIRAQNAADSAAQALASIQAQRWNEMEATLYASNIEEFRARRLLDGMLLAVDASGGCAFSYNFGPTKPGTCNRTYIDERAGFIRSAARYSADAQFLQDATAQATLTNWWTDAQSLVQTLKTSCNPAVRNVTQAAVASIHPQGGDCAFRYTILGAQPTTRTGLGTVTQDAQNVSLPNLGHGGSAGSANENPQIFGPVEIDVATCAAVPPLVPNFGPIHFTTYYAIGRAAATNVMLEQDWLQPGSVDDYQRRDPLNDQVFQPKEKYTVPSPGTIDWYNVDYGGNSALDYGNADQYLTPIQADELDVRLGWWGPIPIAPFSAAPVPSSC